MLNPLKPYLDNSSNNNDNSPSTPSDDIESNDEDDSTLAAKQLALIPYEKWYHILIQVSIPFFIAGGGTIGAGVVLGTVEVSSKNLQNLMNFHQFSL